MLPAAFPTFRKKRIYEFYLVLLAVANLSRVNLAFLGQNDLPELEAEKGGVESLKAVYPSHQAQPIDLLHQWRKHQQAVEKPVNREFHERKTSHSTELQLAMGVSAKLGSFPSNQPSIFSLREECDKAQFGDFANPEHAQECIPTYADPFQLNQMWKPRTGLAAQVDSLTTHQFQSQWPTKESHEADLPPILSTYGFSSCTSPLLHMFRDTELQAELAFSPTFPTDRFSETVAAQSPAYPQSPGDKKMERETKSSRGFQKTLSESFFPTSRCHSEDAAPEDTPTGDCEQIFPGSSLTKMDVRFSGKHSSKRTKTQYEASWSTEGYSEQVTIPKGVLDPEKHGYIKSLKSFIRLIKSRTIQSESDLDCGFWVKEKDARELFYHWKKAKLPYPKPFDVETIRRSYAQNYFVNISCTEVNDPVILVQISEVAEFLTTCMNQNASALKRLIYPSKIKKGKFGSSFITKLEYSTRAALFFIKITNSIFPRQDTNIGLEKEPQDELTKAWKFLKTFWEDLSYFQPDLEQKYNWIEHSSHDSKVIRKILRYVRSNILVPTSTQDTIHLSGLLVEAWLCEKRNSLFKELVHDGEKIDKRYKALVYQYLTYINHGTEIELE